MYTNTGAGMGVGAALGGGGLALTGAPVAAFALIALAAILLGFTLLRTGQGGRHRSGPAHRHDA